MEKFCIQVFLREWSRVLPSSKVTGRQENGERIGWPSDYTHNRKHFLGTLIGTLQDNWAWIMNYLWNLRNPINTEVPFLTYSASLPCSQKFDFPSLGHLHIARDHWLRELRHTGLHRFSPSTRSWSFWHNFPFESDRKSWWSPFTTRPLVQRLIEWSHYQSMCLSYSLKFIICLMSSRYSRPYRLNIKFLTVSARNYCKRMLVRYCLRD